MAETVARVLVVCDRCRTRLHPKAEFIGRRIRCPDCGQIMVIRAEAPLPPTPVREDAGEYEIRGTITGMGTDTGTEIVSPTYDGFLVTCPTCGTRQYPTDDLVGKPLVCPDCRTPMIVPMRPAAPPPAKKPPTARPYSVGEAGERAEVPMEFIQVQSTLTADFELQKGRWLTSRALVFPFRGEARNRWIIWSMILFVPAEIGASFLLLDLDNVYTRMYLVIYATLGLVLMLAAAAYGSVCVLSIVADSGSGNEEVYQWPETDWIEWFTRLGFLVYQFAIAMVCGGLVAQPLSYVMHHAEVVATIIAAILLPIFVLSALETDTFWWSLGPQTLRGLRTRWASWLAWYAIVGTSWVLLDIVSTVLLYFVPLVAPVVVVPMFTALAFISARLLGRLAWDIHAHSE